MRLVSLGFFLSVLTAGLVTTGCNQQTVGSYNTPPQATITLPAPEAIIDDNTVTFAGQVEDDQDAPEELQVRWYDNINPDAPLFDGFADTSGFTQFTTAGLASGTHIITLQVTDTSGATDEVFIELTILTEPPLVTITSPLSGHTYFEGELVPFEGDVASADGTELELSVRWVSDIQGELYVGSSDGNGHTAFDLGLNAGVHIITLYADDSHGVTGQDNTTVDISAFPVGQLDQDGDGFCPDGIDLDGDGECDDSEVTGVGSQDCNDFADTVYPGAPEICDGIDDNNCDGEIDDSDHDSDSDTYTPCQGDCEDENPNVNPGADELCDGLDTNCDGFIPADEVDEDGDGWFLCNDCDDDNSAVNPGTAEICDGFDNDCDGIEDNGFDLDNDGYSTCENDCDDLNNAVNPGVWDDCSDDLDSNCNGLTNDDTAGNYEMWETSTSSPAYELSNLGPQLAPGSGACEFTFLGGPWHLAPGSGSVAGVFSSTDDDLDIFDLETSFSGNTFALAAFLAVGTFPAGCGEGSISWTSAQPISVSVTIDALLGLQSYTGSGTSGSLPFTLGLTEIFDVDYTILVEPMASYTPSPTDGLCTYDYTLDLEIP